MKAVIGFLNKRIKLSEKAGKAVGIVFSMLFAVSLAVFCYLSLKLSIILCVAVFLLICIPFIVFKYYRLINNNTVILHFVCMAAAVYLAFINGEAFILDSQQLQILSYAASGLTFLCFFEFIAGLIMNFSGGKNYPENFSKALLCVFPMFFTAIVYIPSEMFLNNCMEFHYNYIDFAPYIFIKTAIFTFVLSVIVCSFDAKGFDILTKLAAGITLCIYCQYMFMNNDLSPEIGAATDWSALTVQMIVNAFIWLLLIILPFALGFILKRINYVKKHKLLLNLHITTTAFLGAIQLASLIVLITLSFDTLSSNVVSLHNEEQFTVSGNKNIITIIVDAGDQEYFDRARTEQPERFECLKDFTIYTNTCMMYDSTHYSIPQMLTGETSYPEGDGTEWQKNIWQSERAKAFYTRLHDNNYKVNVFGDFLYDYNPLYGKADNLRAVTSEDITIDYERLFQSIDNLAAYRFLPLAAKSPFEPLGDSINSPVNISNKCIYYNKPFLEALDLKKSDDSLNYFIVEHVIGTHRFNPPLDQAINESLDIINRYIAQLKELGLYNDAAIIITADHGEHTKPGNTPIFFMKTPGEEHDEIKYNEAPIYHTDYLASCLRIGGLWQDGDEELFGRAVTDIPENEQRTRLVFARCWYDRADEDGRTAYGYYYTGDRYELERREKSDDPDITLRLSGF